MAASPTSRTLDALRAQGMRAEVVERWNPHSRTRHDLFSFIDIVAIDQQQGAIVGIQATAAAVQARRRKIIEECSEAAHAWLNAGGRIEVWGWRRLKVKRGGKATRWTPRTIEITAADIDTKTPPGAA